MIPSSRTQMASMSRSMYCITPWTATSCFAIEATIGTMCARPMSNSPVATLRTVSAEP
jgi:hypothetical protein